MPLKILAVALLVQSRVDAAATKGVIQEHAGIRAGLGLGETRSSVRLHWMP